MAQTTLGMSSVNARVEYSLDAAAWVEMSGSATSVTVAGGTRVSGEAYTASGDTAFITAGKREPIEVTVAGVYSETTGDPEFFEALAAVYESGAGCAIRWSPTAYDTTNQKRYTTANTAGSAAVGVITAWNYPSVDISSGDPIIVEFTVKCAGLLTEDSA